MVTGMLSENSFRLLDLLSGIAHEIETSPARVALAWMRSRPGVISTIIGARTMEQLDENLGALEIQLGPEHAAALDQASRPRLAFPAGFLSNVGPLAHSGTTINGETFAVSPFAPKKDDERF
jgi:diketogulonate reductase-like aldo/keto reductase